ncbi:MAG: hypothetical protein NC078_11015, partial [Ruminococcus sp.]|nr:hypothetical protein [Ruminococcus sp.]
GYREITKEVTAIFIDKNKSKRSSHRYFKSGQWVDYEGTGLEVAVSPAMYEEIKRELTEMYPHLKDFPYPFDVSVTLDTGTDRAQAEEWLKENIGYFYSYKLFGVPFGYLVFKVVGTILAIIAALIAFANAVNVTMSGILENRKGFALMRAAGMTDSQLESSGLRQSAEPVIWAAVISLVLFSVFVFMSWAEFYDGMSAWNLLAGYGAYIAGVAVTLGVSLLSALPAVREIENEEIAVGVKPVSE